jgi:signal recognition particle receptor subunit beta
MVLFNYSTKELTAKVVYYGPGLCGKTTNLQWIHEKLPIKNKGKMVSLATEADRTLFFDFLPIELGTIRGMKTRVQLYTVPGQVFYNATRRMVLKGADCVVFVADSQEPMIDANLDALANLRENLEANEIDPDEIPTVLQYNKRDLPNALPLEVLNEKLNPKGWLHYEACAKQGKGVEETLKGVTGLVFRTLATKYGGTDAGRGASAPKPAAAAAPAPKPLPAPAPPPRPVAVPPPPPARAAAPLAGGSTDDLLDSLGGPPLAAAPAVEDLTPPAPTEELSLDSITTLPPPGAAAAPMELDLEPDTMPELVALEEAQPLAPEPPGLDFELEAAPAAPPPPAPELDLPDVGGEPAALDDLELPAAPPPPAPPPRAAEPAAVPSAVSAEVPVSVQVSAEPGATDVVIPVEIALAEGTTRVVLNLRLTLLLKLPG